MKNFGITLCLLIVSSVLIGQNLSQTVRGKIIDIDSQLPLIGAEIMIVGSNPTVGTTTDVEGVFRFDNVAIGRNDFVVSYLGFEDKVVSNIIVNSGRETILNIEMQEAAVKIKELVITANQKKGEALNAMSLISARSISPEETNRFAGGFNDPSRIMSNFAGITNTQEGSNDIIVRGNAPKYVQWRLEGVEISNPNHFSDQSSVGGGVSTLNNNLLATSDFYTAAYSPEYGDVLSGVYDVKLRNGNNEKFESVFGFGLLGTDLTLEGPLKRGYGGSFLVNYRYSTASLINELGLLGDISGIPKFQDASFKLMLPTENAGIFSIFGLAGLSSLLFEDVTPALWNLPGDNFMKLGVTEDFDKESYLLNTGVNHTINLGENSYFKSTILFSAEGIDDDVIESRYSTSFVGDSLIFDSLLSKQVNYQGKLNRNTYRVVSTFHKKINAKNRIQIGTKFGSESLENLQSNLQDGSRIKLVDFDERISTLRNFVSWKHRINQNIRFVAGVHNMNVLYNNKSTIEPRLAGKIKIGNAGNLQVGYGLHSTMESLHHYFAQVPDANGNLMTRNKDLGLLKAHHYVVAFEKRIGKNFRGKVEAYYQDLFNLPIENNANSYFSTINEGLEFQYVDLVNEGTGRNYGLEFTLERFFGDNYYYLVNASLYESKFTPLDGIERNTQYSGNYLVNVLAGKEFPNLGKKDNQVLSLNMKLFFAGGRKIVPLLRDVSGNLAVDPEQNQFWDHQNAYANKLEDIYELKLSASYKWNRPKTTHELYLNCDNVINTKGRLAEFYDASEPGSIGYITQFGFFPNLMYRVYL